MNKNLSFQETIKVVFSLLGINLIVASLIPAYLVDDAAISFRYAYNLAHHGQLVYNLGERVEGITNFLWTVFLAFFAKLGLEIGHAAIVFSIILTLWMGFRIYQIGIYLTSKSSVGIQAWALLMLSSGFWPVMVNGLEAALFAVLLAEMMFWFVRKNFTMSFIIAGLLFLTRPEGLAFIFLLAIVIIYKEGSYRPALPGLMIAILFVVILTAFRIIYFGSWLPNSVIAKSFPLHFFTRKSLIDQIYIYFLLFTKQNVHLFIAIAASLVFFFREKQKSGLLLFSLGGALIAGVSVIKNGGDWMPNYRLLFQYGPLFAILLIILLKNQVIHQYVWIALLAILFIQATPTNPISNIQSIFRALTLFNSPSNTFWGQSVALLKPVLSNDDVVAAEGTGYIGYQLRDNYVHDLLGLTDTNIARNGTPYILYGKGNPEYSLSQVNPSVLILHNVGFITKVPQTLLDNYQAYCFQECQDASGADVVMIRKDRNGALGEAFKNWEMFELHTSIQP